jgi:DNA/RNA endonuclease YhcR with UshA esterase domain
MDNNYVITEAGDYTVYFRPDGQGGEDWHYGCINAIKKESPAAISCLEVYQKAKNDAVLLNPVTVTYSNGANVWVMDGSASMLIYLPSGFTNNFQAGDVLSGVAGTVDIYQNIVYEVKPDATQAAAITVTSGEAPAPSQAAVIEASDVNKYVILPGFSIEGAFTADAKTSLPAVLGENTVTIYNNFKFAYTFEAGKTYNITGVVSAYKGNPQVYFISAEETGAVPPTPSINYYVIGSMTEWNVDANYKLVANPAVEGEYMGEFTFANNDEFKIVGDDGSQLIWYPGGTDNNFKITEAGDYKITFNPAGNVEGWYEGFFNVVKKQIIQYEVAEAIAAGLAEGDEVLVRGVISKMQIKGKNFAKYGSVNIYVTDATDAEGEFEFFNCFSFNADTFRTTTPAYDAEGTTWDDLKKVVDENGNEFRLGDTIVAFGKYKLYNTTHELTACYITDLKPAPVKPAQTIEVNMSEGLRFVDYVAAEGWWELYGDDGKYIIDLSNVSTEQIAGEYPIDNLDPDYCYLGIINGEDTTYVSFVDGAITLTVSENGDVTVTGTLVGDDDNSYVLNLAYVVPTAKEEVSVSIADGELYDEYADYGLYVVYGEDENEVYVQLAIWAENGFEGNFTEEDLDAQNIGSFIYDGEEYVEIYSATITVTPVDGGGYNIVATILGYNNKQYTIAMTIPAQEEGIEETLAAGKAAKVLRDGQVLILKGDKTFNVMGARIR